MLDYGFSVLCLQHNKQFVRTRSRVIPVLIQAVVHGSLPDNCVVIPHRQIMNLTSPSTERFSQRAEDYVKYRPTYPPEVVGALEELCHLNSSSRIADVGSGTGLFSTLLLNTGCDVFSVEPNSDMRRAAEEHLSGYSKFHSIAGSAENTELKDASVDIVTVAQAFHWFRLGETKEEFKRILKNSGWVALIWNQRLNTVGFGETYENFLRNSVPDYLSSTPINIDEARIAEFFGENKFRHLSFSNRQDFDFAGLIGRFQSTSYAPPVGSSQSELIREEMRKIFEQYAIEDQVSFEYQTRLFVGQLR